MQYTVYVAFFKAVLLNLNNATFKYSVCQLKNREKLREKNWAKLYEIFSTFKQLHCFTTEEGWETLL